MLRGYEGRGTPRSYESTRTERTGYASPGYFYLYSFRDARRRQRGIHSHYFLFAGRTLITLVLQALPEERFERFAPVFDRITSTFRVGAP